MADLGASRRTCVVAIRTTAAKSESVFLIHSISVKRSAAPDPGKSVLSWASLLAVFLLRFLPLAPTPFSFERKVVWTPLIRRTKAARASRYGLVRTAVSGARDRTEAMSAKARFRSTKACAMRPIWHSTLGCSEASWYRSCASWTPSPAASAALVATVSGSMAAHASAGEECSGESATTVCKGMSGEPVCRQGEIVESEARRHMIAIAGVFLWRRTRRCRDQRGADVTV